MVLQIVSVFDLAAQCFGRPVFFTALGSGSRSFKDEVNRADAGNDLYTHPEDFTLYHLGSFDDSTGQFSLFPMPVIVARAKDVVIAKE